MKELDELEKDFKELLGCIDFEHYDPYSKLFMRALFIGQMYMCVKSLDEDDVEEELEGAEKYIRRYLETDNETYREMARDELPDNVSLLSVTAPGASRNRVVPVFRMTSACHKASVFCRVRVGF